MRRYILWSRVHCVVRSSSAFGRRLFGRLTADTHLDALGSEFLKEYAEGDRQPQWIVTSPPYKHAFAMLRQALVVARVGVIFKLRLSFLEPTKSRGTKIPTRSHSSASPCNLSRKEMRCPGGMDYVALWRNSSQPPCSAGCICCVIVPGRGGHKSGAYWKTIFFSP